jgi:hypothetical protein
MGLAPAVIIIRPDQQQPENKRFFRSQKIPGGAGQQHDQRAEHNNGPFHFSVHVRSLSFDFMRIDMDIQLVVNIMAKTPIRSG